MPPAVSALIVSAIAAIVVTPAPRTEGIGQGRGASSAGASADVCALLTKQEAAAALGEAVKEPSPAAGGASGMPGAVVSACSYDSAASPHHLTLTVWRFPSSSASQLTMLKGMARQEKKELVTGVGDSAWWYDARHQELQAVKGEVLLTVELRRAGDATDAAKTAATKALGRLRNP